MTTTIARSYTDGAAFENARKTVRAAPAQMRNGTKIAVRRERSRLNKEFQRQIPVPRHKFIWSRNPLKQKRARGWWFRELRAGRISTANDRYARSGLLQRSWKLESRIENYFAAITISNTRPGAAFVVGTWQVPSHEDSGYPRIDRLAVQSGERLTNEVIALWQVVSMP